MVLAPGRGLAARPVGRSLRAASATNGAYCATVTGVRDELEGAQVDDVLRQLVAAPRRRTGPDRGRSRPRRRGRRPSRSRPARAGVGGDAEADVVVARRRVHRLAVRAAQLVRPVEERAAADERAAGRPLQDVAGQVEHAVRPTLRPDAGRPARASRSRRRRSRASASGSSSPHGQSRSSPPRAAASHSSSVGSRTPIHAAERLGLGARAHVGHGHVVRRPRSRRTAGTARAVTGVRARRNGVERGRPAAASRPRRADTRRAGSLPIAERPAGTARHSITG